MVKVVLVGPMEVLAAIAENANAHMEELRTTRIRRAMRGDGHRPPRDVAVLEFADDIARFDDRYHERDIIPGLLTFARFQNHHENAFIFPMAVNAIAEGEAADNAARLRAAVSAAAVQEADRLRMYERLDRWREGIPPDPYIQDGVVVGHDARRRIGVAVDVRGRWGLLARHTEAGLVAARNALADVPDNLAVMLAWRPHWAYGFRVDPPKGAEATLIQGRNDENVARTVALELLQEARVRLRGAAPALLRDDVVMLHIVGGRLEPEGERLHVYVPDVVPLEPRGGFEIFPIRALPAELFNIDILVDMHHRIRGGAAAAAAQQ